MERRSMLGGFVGASLTAASYRRVLGANDRVGLAVIGTGQRGLGVAKAFLQTGRAQLSVLCDVYDVRRKEARDKLAAGRAVPEMAAFEDAVARKDVDVVLVATPEHQHFAPALAALAAERHLFLEKPVTHRYEEGAKLIAAVAKSGKVCQTGAQQRSGPHFLRAKHEIFARGRLGKVTFARAVWCDIPRQRRRFDPAPKPAGLDWERFLGPAPRVAYTPQRYETWNYFPEYGNGIMADVMLHWADLAQWMMNDAEPVSAVASGGIYSMKDGRKNPDTASAIIQYKDWNLTFETSVLPAKVSPSVTFSGTEGRLDISRDGYTYTPHKGAPEVAEATGDLGVDHVTNFLDAMKTGRAPSAGIAQGVEACRPTHLAVRAYWERKRMRLNADKSAIIEDDGRGA